jgi:hypothetical protein
MNLYGFTFMKGVKSLDYPFMEVLESLSGMCTKIYAAVGKAEDDTESDVRSHSRVEVIETTWSDKKHGDGGSIFSEQANIALGELRKNHRDDKDAWAIFLHSDEVFHPLHFEKIKKAIEEANAAGLEAIEFPFLHFWNDHYHIAVNKRWHPQEIRAFKIDSSVVCYGDAQGFVGTKKIAYCAAPILHYGHVRDPEKHRAKQDEILRRIRPEEKFEKYRKRELRAFKSTKTQALYLKHPEFMRPRIARLGDPTKLNQVDPLYVVGDKSAVNAELFFGRELIWVSSPREVPRECRGTKMVILRPNLWQRLRYQVFTPAKMASPIGHEWSPEMQIIAQLGDRALQNN